MDVVTVLLFLLPRRRSRLVVVFGLLEWSPISHGRGKVVLLALWEADMGNGRAMSLPLLRMAFSQ
jgi:hypothetical protein